MRTPTCLFAALLLSAASAPASTFSVSGSGNSFTISRNGDTSAAETVLYRTVPLSAFPGQHYTAKSGTLAFAPGQTTTNISVTARTPTADAYRFQTGTTRSYRLALTDEGGFPVTDATRSITTGTSVPSSGAFNVKDVTIQTAEYTADDRGYDKNGCKSAASSVYFDYAAPRAYYDLVGAQLRMTLSMEAKENDDAYEYLQLLFDNTSTCDDRSGCSNGDPGNIARSAYMAGFEMDTGSKDATYRTYTFPVTNAANNAGAANPWGHGTGYPLSKQKFNTATESRAADGRIVVPLNFSSVVLRLNASGSSGSDEWAARNVKARIQAVDTNAPTALAVSVAPGIHAKGNEVYVSVAFSEPVTVTGTPSLTTSWGTLSYLSGSGSNVLAFKGTISATASGALNVTGKSGTIKDLSGKNLSGTLQFNGLASLDTSHAYAIAYDLAGGTLPSGASNPATYTYETPFFILTPPVRPGYNFAGWTGSNGLTPNPSVTIAAQSHGDRAYVANWTPVTYTVHFDANGGTGSMPDQTLAYDTPQALSSNAFTRAGYTFAGWRGADGAIYPDRATVLNLTNAQDAVVSLSATWRVNIPYIDADGTEQVCTEYTVITNTAEARVEYGESSAERWYVVTNAVAIDGKITFLDRYAHLIVCDGATLAATNSTPMDEAVHANGNLTIYGQAGGTGAVSANGSRYGIYAYNGITINGGSVTATAQNYGISAQSVTVNGGTIDANGGTYGVNVWFAITLGWTNPTDSIYASSYAGNVSVKAGQTLTDGTAIYDSDRPLNLAAIAGVTLRPAYRITLPAGVVASGVVTQDVTTAYALPGDIITLSAAAPGYAIGTVTVNGVPLAPVDGTYSFAASAASITVTADVGIPYIDADGVERFCTDFTVLTNAAGDVRYGGGSGWYVVTSNVTISGQLYFRDNSAHLILCDGATLAVTNANGRAIHQAGDLTIYGQTNGTGAVTATGGNEGIIWANNDVTINGGTVTANGTNGNGIFAAVGSVTINGGTVTANGGTDGNGIRALNGSVTLGWTKPTDSITASSYSAYNGVSVKSGQTLTDGTTIYKSGYNLAAIAGVTLRPAYSISLPAGVVASGVVTQGDTTAYALPGATVTLSAAAPGYALGDVSVNGVPLAPVDGTYAFAASDAAVTIAVTMTPITYTVRFDAGGGEGPMPDQSFTYDTPQAIASNAFTRAGYTFAGWRGADGTIYADGAEVINLTNAQDAVVSLVAQWGIPYIDADGTERICTDYTVITNAEGYVEYGGGSGWYVVTNSVTISGQLHFNDSTAHLILCDGATFAVTNENGDAIDGGNALTIYGQTNGTGSVTAEGGGSNGIAAQGSVTINGGTVTAEGGSFGIYSGGLGSVTINGGTVTANGTGYGIFANGSVTINGGTVTAEGGNNGIFAGSVTLGWTNPTDSITASSYRGVVIVKGAQPLTDGIAIYQGEVDPAKIAGKTLRPYFVPYIDADGVERFCTDYTVLTNAAGDVEYGGGSGWYVVTTNVTISGRLYFRDNSAHLILCDGVTLAVTNANGTAIVATFNLTIYGQTNGTGAVTANGDTDGISAAVSVTINGGTVTATGGNGIFAGGAGGVTINGGSVTATGNDNVGIFAGGAGGVTINGGSVTANGDNRGIYTSNNGSVTINGGTVTATGNDNVGIFAGGAGGVTINGGTVTANGGIYANSIILGWTNPTDSITASSYNRNVSINKALTDGSTIYESGHRFSPSAIKGATLRPAYRITLPANVVASGVVTQIVTTAYARPGDTVTLSAAAPGYAIGTVTVNGNALEPVDGVYTFTASADAVTISATVTPVTYVVRFDAGGGEGSMPDQSFTYGAPQALTSNAFTRTGYTFAGWLRADGAIYPDGATVSNLIVRYIVRYADNKEDTWKRFDRMPYPGKTNDDYHPGDGALQNTDGDNGLNLYTGFENSAWNPDEPATAALISQNVAWFDEHDARNGVSMKLIEDFPNFYKEPVVVAQDGVVTLTAIWHLPVPYIDADGIEQLCTDYTVITDSTGDVAYGGGSGWYVVTNAVTINGQLRFNDYNAHLILCDGATLAVTNANGRAIQAGDLTIYGQTNGTGAVTATGGNEGIIWANNDVTINGGTVTANGTNGNGIFAAVGSVTINGGTVTANGGTDGNGIRAQNGSVTLGWTKPTDSITASSYSAYNGVSVKSGQRLTDGTAIYKNDISDPSAIAGVTLVPFISEWGLLQAQLNAGGTVTLTNDVTATDVDSSLTVTNAVTLDLNGHTIDADRRFCVIQVLRNGDLTLTNSVEGTGAIVNGYDRNLGGGVYVNCGTFTMAGGAIAGNGVARSSFSLYGGGVYVSDGTFTMTGGAISNNVASDRGGGVYVGGGAFTMSGGEIAGNTANGSGGGVYIYSGRFTLAGGTIANNVAYARGSDANRGGGGVFIAESATFAMSGGTILTNAVPSADKAYGGGVFVAGGGTSQNASDDFTMTGGTISGNYVTTSSIGNVWIEGGGVSVTRGKFTMSDGEISGNLSSKNGGGVSVRSNSIFMMTGGIIAGNTAECRDDSNTYGGGGVYVADSTFTMIDSTISGNVVCADGTDSSKGGGGAYLRTGTFRVSGVSSVSGNTNSAGAASNVYLPSGKKIAISGLSAGASIGVTTATKPTSQDSATFTDLASAADAAYFFSDNPAYSVDTDEYGELCLVLSDPVAEPTPVATTWDFVVSEGWTAIGDPFTGETNALGRTWTLAGCRVDPAGEAGGDTGCLSLQSPGSAAVAPAFRGVVTQVTTLFRPVTAGSTREVSLLASVDGGATFSVVTNVAVPVRQNYENTFVFDVPLDGGDLGVVFCASNSGAAGTVQLRRLTIEGTSTAPEEPGLHDWSPFGSSAAEQPRGALSGVVLFLDPGLGYAADPATNAWTTGAGLANGVVADFGNLDQMNFLARQAWKAGATIVPLRPLGYQTNEVVVDNADAARVTFGGAWANAVTNRHYGRAGDVGYRWTYACPTGATAWASYRPDIPVAGEYPVYAWAPAGADRVPQLYRVRHAGGVTDVRVDHRRVGDGWVWLGSFRFAEGTAGCVNVSNYSPGCGEGSIVVADAIRFGNGMGDVARGAAGVSGLERELEASRYWIERQALDSQGFPASVYDGAGTDRADADLAPARMAEHMGRMDDGPAWSSILVALDDMAMDATTLKSLRGREALARDMLRDVVHDLAAFRDDDPAAATLPPDAPVAVAATNAGYGRATVSWRMPASKVSDPHTGFVVYASTDGYAFGNPVAVASAADEGSHTFDGLPAGEPYFFRVCAVNAGGESLPSPVAGVGLSFDGSAATVLLVDGFHRADAGLTPVRRYDRVAGADGPVDVPLVRPRMINSFDYVKEHGNAIAAAGRSFDSMDSALVTAADLAGHPFAVWFVGREGVETETLSYDEQRLIATFLDNRGFLFLSGSDIGRDLGSLGTASDRAFLEDRLRCTFVADDGETGIVGGKTGSFLAGVAVEFNYTNALDDIYAAGRAEVFAPCDVGFSAALYGGANGTEAAMVAQDNTQWSNKTQPRTIIAGFPFETIPDKTQRHKLMKTILDFFDDHAISPAWDGHTAYTTGIGGTVEIALKTQVTGWPSPAVTILETLDYNTDDEVDPSLYTITADRFVFTASAAGTYTFTFRAENDAGSINQDVVITVGNAPVWQRVGDILLDLGAATNVNLRSLVSGSPAPAIALDPDRTAADPATYGFDPATGILSLGPSDDPATNAFVFVATNEAGTDALAITNVIRRLDTDGDGIPDWWATEHFGGPTGCPNPNLDPDGDRFSNLEEFESLTDPRDRYSQPLPAYLDDAAPAVLTNYVDWACLHGPDLPGLHLPAFLLNVAPAATPAELRIDGIEVGAEGATIRASATAGGAAVDLTKINGILAVEAGDTVTNLVPKAVRGATFSADGTTATIPVPSSDGFFLRARIGTSAP